MLYHDPSEAKAGKVHWRKICEGEPPFQILVRALLDNGDEILVVRQKANGKGDGQPSIYLEMYDMRISSDVDFRYSIVVWRRVTKKEKEIDSPDKINHPEHYGGDNPYECIKVLEQWLSQQEMEGALKFNVIKYLQRYQKKNGLRDLYKAQWYLNRLISNVEEQDGNS